MAVFGEKTLNDAVRNQTRLGCSNSMAISGLCSIRVLPHWDHFCFNKLIGPPFPGCHFLGLRPLIESVGVLTVMYLLEMTLEAVLTPPRPRQLKLMSIYLRALSVLCECCE